MKRVIIPGATHMTVINSGDGSAYVRFFSSRKLAERFMEGIEDRFCDDIINVSSGVEVDPLTREERLFVDTVNLHLGEKTVANSARRNKFLRDMINFWSAWGLSDRVITDWSEGVNLPSEQMMNEIMDSLYNGSFTKWSES